MGSNQHACGRIPGEGQEDKEGDEKEGIDLLLLYGNGFNEYGNYCYLSNTIIRLPQGAMVAVPQKGDLTLMFEGASRGISSIKKLTWIDDVRASGDVSKECVNYLKEKNPSSFCRGMCGPEALDAVSSAQFLLDSLPGCKIVDSDRLLNELRMVKSRMESFRFADLLVLSLVSLTLSPILL